MEGAGDRQPPLFHAVAVTEAHGKHPATSPTSCKEVTMKRSYFLKPFWSLPGILVGIVLLCAIIASAQAPSIEGTYKLIARQLPDGTILRPPDIMGLWTYTKSHRNFNFVRKDAMGKFRSFSIVSTYTLTATEYSETLLFSIFNDQIGEKEIVYDLSGKTQTVPVKMEGGRIQFKPPFDTPTGVFEGNKITVTTPEGAVDVWEKVQ
jgi:hypothetical protein